jgi:hypothetical protein
MDELPLTGFPALSFPFDKPANAFFADWLALARAQAPQRVNLDKSRIYEPADDVRRAFLKAWLSIAEEAPYKRRNEGWCRGFLLGFVQSNLSVLWSGEFLTPGPAQRNAHWLQAMILYLDSYPTALLHVNRLYQRILENDGTPSVLAQGEDAIKAHHLVSDLQANDTWRSHKPYLEAHVLADITKAVHDEKGVESQSIAHHFTESNVAELVILNPYL